MSQTLGETGPRIGGSRRYAGVALVVLGVLGTMTASPSASASPIRQHWWTPRAKTMVVRPLAARNFWTAQPLTAGSYWNRYFARALRTHQARVRGPNAVRVLSRASDANGRLPDSAFVEYLQWRRSLNPARFDAFHPRLGQILDRDLVALAPIPPLPEPGQLTPPPPPIIPPQPPPIVPPEPPSPEIPEPSSIAVALVLLAAGAWARRRSRFGPADKSGATEFVG